MSKIKTPALWQEFYKVATQFRNVAPWRWMHDSDIFGVKNPETGEIGWCCIMGNAGEHYALAVYRGADGLETYFDIANADHNSMDPHPEQINTFFRQDCWMVSFEDAKLVGPDQKKHLKALGQSFRGAHQWIVVSSFDPGFDPWLPEEKDLPFLIQCLQQSLDVAFRYEDKPSLLPDEGYLVRTPQAGPDGQLLWEDRHVAEAQLPEPKDYDRIPVRPSFVNEIQKMETTEGAILVASFFTQSTIRESKELRPWRPMLVVAIQYGSGYIIHHDLMALGEVKDKMLDFLLDTYKVMGVKPRQLGVHHFPVYALLEENCRAAGIELLEIPDDNETLLEVLAAFKGYI